jgi:hypothetical protein
MSDFLDRALALDENFCQGCLTRITFSLNDQDPVVTERRQPLTLIVFHPSVMAMMLWEVGLSATNSTVSVFHNIRQ